ncbi:MAG: four helix bundle protein [Chloroflexi bacterium]|nr:four helix bundle protein [Chloroflexota bacterium]
MQGRHKDLEVWKKSINFVVKIYEITGRFPENEKYGIIAQLRRAAVSIPSNIAEGAARKTRAEYIQFLYIARGSINEIDTQIEIVKRLNYINEEKYTEVINLLDEISRLVNGLIKSLKVVKS